MRGRYQDMHNAWDELCKRFMLAEPEAFLQWVWPEATLVEPQLNELQAVKLNMDYLLHVCMNGQDILLHVEFQTHYDATMPERLLEYNIVARRQRKLPIWSIVVHLKNDTPIKPAPLRWRAGNREVVTFHYDVLELSKLSPESIRQTGIEPLCALIPLTKGGASRQEIRDTVRSFEREKQEELANITLAFAMLILQDKDKEVKWLKEEFMSMTDILEELPIFRDIFRKNREEAKEEGRAEGRAEEGADILLTIIQKRFPALVDLARIIVQNVNSVNLLKEAIVEMSIAQTEEEARQRLCSYLPS